VERFITVQKRGTIALPPDTRQRHHLDDPGTQLRLVERDDGVIELHPTVPVPAENAWFWTDRWQAMEREAAEDIAEGRTVTFDDVESFLADLDAE
jgi:bifunctional DNA-binding transcriptional regulator/antitoxin component of YhaV-PrlF toxin-antitoxin module